MFGQDEDTDIEKANKLAAATQAIQIQKEVLTENIGSIFGKFGLGMVAFGVVIYWFLIKR